MEQKIKTIVEAFSIQPESFSVADERHFEHKTNSRDLLVKEIKHEMVHVGPDIFSMYVGYNFEGKKLFQYHTKSVNLHYFI